MAELTPTRASIRRTWRWFRWRSALLALVFGCGLLAFALGVGVSARPELVQGGLLSKAYYTVGLFVLGGLDLGVPHGGPRWARGLLWAVYFAAPAITASAVVEGALRILRPGRWALRRLRGHVVVAGCGKLTMQYLARLRAVDPSLPVVIVELRTDQPAVDEARELYGALIVPGDITSDVLLPLLRLEHAQRVLLLTGDDFNNLDAASKIIARAPQLHGRVIAHVADLRFKHVMRETPLAKACVIFNSHQAAAEKLVRRELLHHFDRTEPLDTVVIAGFGRFGQTVLAELQRHAECKFDTVVLVDSHCERAAAVFAEQVGYLDSYSVDQVSADVRDPLVWQQLAQRHNFAEGTFIIGSGDDGTNVEAAMLLAGRYPDAFVVARTFRPSSFAKGVSASGGFLAFSVAELIAESIPDTWLQRH